MSLRSIIRKGHFFYNWKPDTWEARQKFKREVAAFAVTCLTDPDTILVNAQSVLEDVLPSRYRGSEADYNDAWMRALKFEDVPRPKPPFEHMWLEAVVDEGKGTQQKIGALVKRVETHGDIEAILKRPGITDTNEGVRERVLKDRPATIINCAVFHDFEGGACFTGSVTYFLDNEGNFQWSFRQVPNIYEDDGIVYFGGVETDEEKDLKKKRFHHLYNLKLREAWVLQSFARMNCANVELRPMKESKLRPHPPNKVRPATVWHEIVITSVPKQRAGGHNDLPQDHSQIREHWIRGHYADYRAGKGLFGRIHGLFWIPEHKAGNPELGQVIPEYTVA